MILTEVHPLLRGEFRRCNDIIQVKGGSSPLARGTLCEQGDCVVKHRFIPACAGNSNSERCPNRNYTVHPRLRGELISNPTGLFINSGSSPLARGTLRRICEGFAKDRFIPACAGNSEIIRREEILGTVHPRLRGELSMN